MRLHAGYCHVGAADVVATTSARTPRPVHLRGQAASGVHLKAGRNARSTVVLALATPLRRTQLSAAATREPETAHSTSNGAASNGIKLVLPSPQQSMAAVHGGDRTGRPTVHDAIATPIVQSSTYFFKNTQEVIDFQEGRLASHE